jgi:hypothetical protein
MRNSAEITTIYIHNEKSRKQYHAYKGECKVRFRKGYTKKQRSKHRNKLKFFPILNLIRNKELAREAFGIQFMEYRYRI